jgi:hypothetical protein
MRVVIDSKLFKKEMNNIIDYSFGFIEGVQRGKKALYAALGPQISEYASQFIDANARTSPELLHHIYEWDQTGSPKARLFDIDYTISNIGLTFKSSFKQSTSIKNGSTVPFYNKAQIMESGVAVTIKPKKANVLSFEIGGEQVFTPNPVRVENPGGQTQGQFENTINNFFGVYFRQSFLRASGLQEKLSYPKVYKKNLNAAKRSGRSLGIKTGFQWVANAGVIK